MHRTRPLDSKLAHSVTWSRFTSDGHFLALPDNLWDIVVMRRQDRLSVMRTGLTTRPDTVTYSAGDEMLVISFLPHCFTPSRLGDAMRNEACFLELFGRHAVRLGAAFHETPTFENAEGFVERLVAAGAVEVNTVVESIVQGPSRAVTERTMQRHFLKTTGLTYKHFTMIERAQKAASLLRMGKPAVEVALALGYSDQAHMINSLKRILGRTPGEIARSVNSE
jgi:hypothetical protein